MYAYYDFGQRNAITHAHFYQQSHDGLRSYIIAYDTHVLTYYGITLHCTVRTYSAEYEYYLRRNWSVGSKQANMRLLVAVLCMAAFTAANAYPFIRFSMKDLGVVPCPNSTSQCPSGNTCCYISSNKQWGCCPLLNAVCCSDYKHCCPSGYKCETNGMCTDEAETITMFKQQPSLKNVVCPDGQSQCPDANTCCKLSSGQWGCCPILNAVCCSDGKHCCPSGYTCELSSGTCTKEAETIAMFTKQPALKNVICPDGQSQCPDGDTCCMLTSGQWGCCPSPNAVCCSDGKHCCPSGYTCEVGSGECIKEAETIAMLKKQPALRNVICPDGQSQCPDGNTCCKLSSGQWGCCPILNAVCCSDGKHCCPSGYTCELSSGTCTKEAETIAMFTKQPALKNVICPDGQSQCPDGDTCCMLTSGQWGCCPSPNAVCCSDGKHCCPSGYTCEVGSGECIKEAETIAMLKKQPALRNVICPDGQSQCPDGNTCCKLSSGVWGCCPVPNAVCCTDGKHCCPSGYTCEVSSGTCTKQEDLSMSSFLTKIRRYDDRAL